MRVLGAVVNSWAIWRDDVGISASSCVWATRAGIEVLRHFGIRARPLSVSIGVYNAGAVAQVVAAGRPLSAEEMDWDRGWAVGTDPDQPALPAAPGRKAWNGHLIVEVPALDVLVDLSLDQYARPIKNLVVVPSAFAVDDDWRRRRGSHWRVGDCMVSYRARPDNTGWKGAGDWRNYGRDIVGLYIRVLERVLAERAGNTA